MYSVKATERQSGDGTSGRNAISGETAMRAAEMAFGRFTAFPVPRRRATSREGLQHQLADRLERLEHAVPGHGHRLEPGCALDPFARG